MPDARSALPPYWTRLPSFLLYPLSTEPLLVCTGLALLTSLAGLMFFPVNALLGFFAFAGLLRYGFFVLERTARGHLDDSRVIFDSAHEGRHLPYKVIAVTLVGLCLCGLAAKLAGPNAAWLTLALLALLWPANTMVLALDNDLGESLNPGRLWQIASRIGMPYLGLCACLLLIFSGSHFLQAFLARVAPSLLVIPVTSLASCLSTIAMFRMMGYVLYQFHEELGTDVQVGFEAQSGAADPRAQRAAKIAELLREGRGEEALAEARDAARSAPADHEAQARLNRLLVALPGCEDELARHARTWLPALLRDGRTRQALEILEQVRRTDAGFLPGADDRLPLAEEALTAHRPATVKALVKDFDKLFPGHRDTPAIYLAGARLLIEHLRDEEQAERVLEALQQHYPEHPAAREAVRLHELAARLRSV